MGNLKETYGRKSVSSLVALTDTHIYILSKYFYHLGKIAFNQLNCFHGDKRTFFALRACEKVAKPPNEQREKR